MIFSEDSISFSLAANPLKSEEQLSSGLWLVLVGVNEIPPHIALISNGKYYSVSARKVNCGTSLERFLGVLERKKVSTLFIYMEIDNKNILLHSIHEHLQPLCMDDRTCLYPIKKFFAESISGEFEKINYVYDLLALSEKKRLLKECVSLHIEATIAKNITLPKYTMVQIRNRIDQVSHQTAH